MDTIKNLRDPSKKTLLTLAASVLAGAAAGYAAGLLAPQPKELPPLAAPAAESHAASADEARLERIESALRRLEDRPEAAHSALAAGDRAPSAADLVQKAPSAPVTADDVQRFYELERAVARHRSLLGRQERAKGSVLRMLDEAKAEGRTREAADKTLAAYFAQEQRLVLTDRTALDDAGRARLEREREALRDRTLGDLVDGGMERALAQAVTDQLFLGKAPGIPMRSPQSLQGIAAGEVTLAPGAPVPGHGGIVR